MIRKSAGICLKLFCAALLLGGVSFQTAHAQVMVAKPIADPQKHISAIMEDCLNGIPSCVEKGLISSFGPAAISGQDVRTMVRTFAGTKGKQWLILSDTQYGDMLRFIYSMVSCDDDTQLFFRGQFAKVDGKWKTINLDFQTSAKDIFIPLPTGGTQIPVTEVYRPTR